MTYRLLRREADRDEDAELERKLQATERRRQQATLVACWYHQLVDEDTGDVESGAKIRDASALPIYDVSIRWAGQRTTDEELERTWSDVSFYAVGFDVIPPSDRSQFVGLPAGQGFDRDKHLWAPTRMGVQMSFHDSANVRWVRRIDGTLDEDHDDAVAQEPPGWELVKVIYC